MSAKGKLLCTDHPIMLAKQPCTIEIDLFLRSKNMVCIIETQIHIRFMVADCYTEHVKNYRSSGSVIKRSISLANRTVNKIHYAICGAITTNDWQASCPPRMH